MNNLLLISLILLIAVIVIITTVTHFRKRERKLVRSLQGMLEEAKAGELTIQKFEESDYSSLENDFYNYLMQSELTKEQLQEQKAVIQTLISDISHQCVTPISNILLYAQLLEEKQDTPLKEIRLINQQTEKLDFLIQALVKMSRLESGTIVPVSKQQAVLPLLESLVDQFQSNAEDKRMMLEIKPTKAKASYDSKWTGEAIGNILDNAIKYSPNNSLVQLSAESLQMFTRIDVTDNGSGIAEEEINQIFQRFYRSDTAAEKPGIGVGLYLARQIIEAQGGYIKVKSKLGEGTTFSIYLPNE